jgi:hypothetical protein
MPTAPRIGLPDCGLRVAAHSSLIHTCSRGEAGAPLSKDADPPRETEAQACQQAEVFHLGF